MEKRFEDRLKIPDADGKKKDESAAAAGKIFMNNKKIRRYKVKISGFEALNRTSCILIFNSNNA